MKNDVNVHKDFFFLGATALLGQGLLIIEASRSHSDTPHSVGLLWTSDQPLRTDLYLTTHNNHRHTHPCPPRHSNPQYRQASGCKPTPWTTRPPGSAIKNCILYNITSLRRSELYLSYKTIWHFALTLFAKSLIFILLIIVMYHLIFMLLELLVLKWHLLNMKDQTPHSSFYNTQCPK
jgi:hypothetical protein